MTNDMKKDVEKRKGKASLDCGTRGGWLWLTRFTIPQCAGARRLALYSKAGFVPKETIIFPTTVPVFPK